MFPLDMLIDQTLGNHIQALATGELCVRVSMSRQEVGVQRKSIGKGRSWVAPWTFRRFLDLW